MKNKFLGKLGFIHRWLWGRDGFYRLGLLFGAAPLIGCAVAIGIWFMLRALPAPIAQPPEWSKRPQATDSWSTTGEPQTVEAAGPIPSVDATGTLSGYETGWRATIHSVEVSPTLNVEIQRPALNTLLVDGPQIDLAQIIEAGPKEIKFVGTGSAFLAIRTAGVYALSLRFERGAGPIADCLTRLGFGPRKVVSNYELATAGNSSKSFDAARFDLQPGLYPIGWAFGCWRDHEPVGGGRITVLISRPGDTVLQPARPEDIVRQKSNKDAAPPPQAQTPARPAMAAAAAATSANPPRSATTPVAAPDASTIDQTSGLDRAVLGRTFQDTLPVNDYKVPLPPGQWVMLANGTVANTTHPENKGTIYFLGQIVQKRLVAAVWIEAMRSPGLGFARNDNCSSPGNLYGSDEPGTADHQSCRWIRSYFAANMQQWADKSAHIDTVARAVGGNLAGKGVSYPQEFVMTGFWEAEKWGQLNAGYMFNPEKEGISSNVVVRSQDSDWQKSNLQRYPEKVAYVSKLQQWAANFQPKFQAAFAAGKRDADH